VVERQFKYVQCHGSQSVDYILCVDDCVGVDVEVDVDVGVYVYVWDGDIYFNSDSPLEPLRRRKYLDAL